MSDRRPHSRACGVTPHAHGRLCSWNCPTCGGKPVTDEDTEPTPPRCEWWSLTHTEDPLGAELHELICQWAADRSVILPGRRGRPDRHLTLCATHADKVEAVVRIALTEADR